MRLGIDASNIRSGGSMAHLRGVLSEARPEKHGIESVVVWGGAGTLGVLPRRTWLEKRHSLLLDRPLAFRVLWQQAVLPAALKAEGCGALFAPGGTLPWLAPDRAVLLSQNILPFAPEEAAAYGWPMRLKLRALRTAQKRSLRRARGAAFLTEHARDAVSSAAGGLPGRVAVIPHGVDEAFFCPPRRQDPPKAYSADLPFRFLYVSTVDVYKHQVEVSRAAARLRADGLPVSLSLVGGGRPADASRLERELRALDPGKRFLSLSGPAPHELLPAVYRNADAFVFASSAESLPNILIEAMAAGLPIACSRRGPMPEVLGPAGVYFEPGSVDEIAGALRALYEAPDLRRNVAALAHERARNYSWRLCAERTLSFIKEAAWD